MQTTPMLSAALQNRSTSTRPPLKVVPAHAPSAPRAITATGAPGHASSGESFLARAFATWASGGGYR